MTENCMTPDHCRDRQIECAAAVRTEIGSLRTQTASDIAIIRSAVQDIDRAVAQIKGYLGLNGSAKEPQHHKRDNEQEEHLHRRITDLAASVDRLHAAREESGDWRVKVMWGVGVFLATALAAPILYAAGAALAKRLVP